MSANHRDPHDSLQRPTAREQAAAAAVREASQAGDREALQVALEENHAARAEVLRELGFEPAEWGYQCELRKPSTRRIEISFTRPGNHWHPTRREPRLTLQGTIFRRTAIDAITFCDESFFEKGKGYEPAMELCRRVCPHMDARARAGTWERYFQEVENTRALIRGLGWQLTAKEQRLMDALEAYIEQAPARVRRVA